MCTLVDLNSILGDIAARIRPIVSDKFVLRTQFDPNLACIRADPKQMDWLFVNLAADASDGMRSGGELIITTANVELNPSSGREMKLPPGQYVQVEFSVTRGFLEVKPTIRNILQRIHGAIAARGTSGTGMVCDILLPRASEAASPAVQRQSRRGRPGPVVLMVSGDSAARALSSDLLREAGYHVLEAADGLEAETVLAAGEVDLMITDIVMPEQDGLETILSVRAIYPGLKIIAVAENDAGSELRTAKLFGADSVISKPLVRSILCAAVHDQIGGAGRSAE
jgi:two-component system, cell cycle sensor histidine kinase and response regulator CckA